MSDEITADFEIIDWNETAYDEPAEGPKLTRAVVRKRFSGAIEGESVAELLTAQGEAGRGYVASERFAGTIEGRRGTVVFQHGGLHGGADSGTFGSVVPGSGTAELADLAGTITYVDDETGTRVTLTTAGR